LTKKYRLFKGLRISFIIKLSNYRVLNTVAQYGGRDQVIIYIEDRKARKTLPPGQGLRAGEAVIGILGGICGSKNVVLQ